MTDKELMQQALEALEDACGGRCNAENNPCWQREIATALRERLARQEDEPLGYWNAVEGWVELPEDAQKPTAWVYPEGLAALQQGKPWTAYGLEGAGPNSDGVERIPLYTRPQPAAWVGLTDEDLSVCGDEDDVMLARYWERVIKEKNT